MGYLLDLAMGANHDVDTERLTRLRASFDLVMAAFRAPADEIALAWSIALRDLDAAEAAFHYDAAMIHAGWHPLEEQAAAFRAGLKGGG